MTDTTATSAHATAAKAVLVTLAAAQFVMILDASVMNVSIATVAKDLGTTVTGIQTAITLYTLVMASLMITGGRMGAILGRKRAFSIGCVIYACGSLITAISPNLARADVRLVVPRGRRRRARHARDRGARRVELRQGRSAEGLRHSSRPAGAIAVGVGPLIGGLFTTYWSWRYVFVGEVFVIGDRCCCSTAAPPTPPRRKVPASTSSARRLSALGLGLIVYGVLRLGTWGFVQPKPGAPKWLGLSPVIWLMLGGGVVLFGFLVWEKHRRDAGRRALLDPAILRVRLLRSGLVAFFFQFLLQAGLFFAVPLFLSIALGLSRDRHRGADPAAVDHAGDRRHRDPQGVPAGLAAARRRSSGSSLLFLGLVVFVGRARRRRRARDRDLADDPRRLGIGALASQLGAVTVSARARRDRAARSAGLQNTASNLGISIGTALAGAVLISALTASFFTGIAEQPRRSGGPLVEGRGRARERGAVHLRRRPRGRAEGRRRQQRHDRGDRRRERQGPPRRPPGVAVGARGARPDRPLPQPGHPHHPRGRGGVHRRCGRGRSRSRSRPRPRLAHGQAGNGQVYPFWCSMPMRNGTAAVPLQ